MADGDALSGGNERGADPADDPAVRVPPRVPTVTVQRWKRHGNDRAYVKVDDVQVGYRDVATAELHCWVEAHRETIQVATEHLITNRPSVPDPVAAVEPPLESEQPPVDDTRVDDTRVDDSVRVDDVVVDDSARVDDLVVDDSARVDDALVEDINRFDRTLVDGAQLERPAPRPRTRWRTPWRRSGRHHT